jgi:hypothetical protein
MLYICGDDVNDFQITKNDMERSTDLGEVGIAGRFGEG